jgi:hypothetical protein
LENEIFVRHCASVVGLGQTCEGANGPNEMQQLSSLDKLELHLRGYAGNTARNHVDFLPAMPAWFGWLRIR